MIPKLLFIFLFFLISNCSGERKNTYKELFIFKVILDNANKTQPNPLLACQSTLTAMQSCAATATEFSTITLSETILAASISSNKYFTYSDFCNNLITNEPYTKFSDSLKECYLKCDTSYWDTRKTLSICNSSFSSMYTSSFTESGTISCKRNCSTSTNNNP